VPQNVNFVMVLNSLARVCLEVGKYDEVERLSRRALAIGEEVLGREHSETANSLNILADLYTTQGRYTQAEPLYQRALLISEKVLGQNIRRWLSA